MAVGVDIERQEQIGMREQLQADLTELAAKLQVIFDQIPDGSSKLRRILAVPRFADWEALRKAYRDWLQGLEPSDWRESALQLLSAFPEPSSASGVPHEAIVESTDLAGRMKATRRALQGPAQVGDAAAQRLDHITTALGRLGEFDTVVATGSARILTEQIAGLMRDLKATADSLEEALGSLSADFAQVISLMDQFGGVQEIAPDLTALLTELDPAGASGLSESDRAEGDALFAPMVTHIRTAASPIEQQLDATRAEEALGLLDEMSREIAKALSATIDELAPMIDLAGQLGDPTIPFSEIEAADFSWLQALYTMETERALHDTALLPPDDASADEEAAVQGPADAESASDAGGNPPASTTAVFRDRLAAARRVVKESLSDPSADLIMRLGGAITVCSGIGILGATDMLERLAPGNPLLQTAKVAMIAILCAQLVVTLLAVRAVASPTLRRLRGARDEMERMALCDPLTELYNRRGLQHLLREEFSAGDGTPKEIAVMHIDLDHFKAVNDTRGHDAGDHVLRVTAERMQSVVGNRGRVCRVGGDEFCAALPGMTDKDTVAEIAAQIIKIAHEPIDYDGSPCKIGASIGIAFGGGADGTTDPELLLNNADLAVFVSKEGGRGRYSFFDNSLRASMETEARIVDRLYAALDKGELTPWFQPVMDLECSEILSAEALIRWQHPEEGEIPPDLFLPIAEKHSLLDRIHDLVLEQSLAAMASWRARGIAPPMITMNLSNTEVKTQGLVDRIQFALDRADVPPSCFGVEVAESVCTDRGHELGVKALQDLRSLGVTVIVDHFGRDQASLSNISRMRATVVKIDRHVVMNLGQNSDSTTLLSGLATIAFSLNLEVIAKGVEGREQLHILQDVICNGLQGYAVARPMPLNSFAEWLDMNAPSLPVEDRPAASA